MTTIDPKDTRITVRQEFMRKVVRLEKAAEYLINGRNEGVRCHFGRCGPREVVALLV